MYEIKSQSENTLSKSFIMQQLAVKMNSASC